MHEALIGYYPRTAHDEIASLLGKSPHQLDDDFQAEIAEVLFILDNGDALRQSPQKHSRDALQLISTRAQALVEALKSINEEAWWVLGKEFSERKELDQHLNEASSAPEGAGCTEQNDDPIGELILRLQQLDELARISLNAFRQTGRPANGDIPDAIKRLRRIWTDATKTDPTMKYDKKDPGRGRFLRFCQLVLTPTLSEYGRPLKLERAVRSELYGQKPRRRSEG